MSGNCRKRDQSYWILSLFNRYSLKCWPPYKHNCNSGLFIIFISIDWYSVAYHTRFRTVPKVYTLLACLAINLICQFFFLSFANAFLPRQVNSCLAASLFRSVLRFWSTCSATCSLLSIYTLRPLKLTTFTIKDLSP